MKQTFWIYLTLIGLAMLMVACQPQTTATVAMAGASATATQTLPAASATPTTQPSATRTKQPTVTLRPWITPIYSETPAFNRYGTNTPETTSTPTTSPTTTQPTPPPHTIGTALPPAAEINASNVLDLGIVSRWGNGQIADAAFSPDGKKFAVISELGVAIYDTSKLKDGYDWIAFPEPYYGIMRFLFSEDGRYLKLDFWEENTYVDLEQKEILKKKPSTNWIAEQANLYRMKTQGDHEELLLQSHDGLKVFQPEAAYEQLDYLTYYINQISDSRSGDLLYQLPDKEYFYRVLDYIEPEGCDLNYFSPCAEAVMPMPMKPNIFSFSPNDRTFSIIYQPAGYDYWSARSMGVMRVYQTESGNLLQTFGDHDNAVIDFSYAPDGKTLAVVYKNGIIQFLDAVTYQVKATLNDFNSFLNGLEFSTTGKFVLLQRQSMLEIRTTATGELRSLINTRAHALHPNEDWLAFGNEAGEIRLIDLGSGKTLQHFSAHTNEIYALAFSGTGQLLASSSQDCTARIWDATTGDFLHYLEEFRLDAHGIDVISRIFVYHFTFIPDSNQIIGFGSWGTAVIWNQNSGAADYKIASAPLQYYQGMMTVKPHYPETYQVDAENNVLMIGETAYDLQSGEEINTPSNPKNLPQGCSESGSYSKDGSLLFTSGKGEFEGQICVLDATDYHLIHRLVGSLDMGYPQVSPDGSRIIVPASGGVVLVYQVKE